MQGDSCTVYTNLSIPTTSNGPHLYLSWSLSLSLSHILLIPLTFLHSINGLLSTNTHTHTHTCTHTPIHTHTHTHTLIHAHAHTTTHTHSYTRTHHHTHIHTHTCTHTYTHIIFFKFHFFVYLFSNKYWWLKKKGILKGGGATAPLWIRHCRGVEISPIMIWKKKV